MPGRQESDIIIQKDAPKSKKETKRDSELQSRLFSLCHGDFAVGDGSLGVSRNTTPTQRQCSCCTRAHIHTPLSFMVNALGRLEKEKCLLHLAHVHKTSLFSTFSDGGSTGRIFLFLPS